MGFSVQGATAGAGAGSSFGPWGAVAGGILGGFFGGDDSGNDRTEFANQQMERQLAAQREFAQNGIRWRVEDAKAAGIHPLFALGASLPSASPVTVFDGGTESNMSAQMGQDIGRAIDSMRTPEERVGARLEALQLERAELENEFLRSRIRNIDAQNGPPMPSFAPNLQVLPGQGDSSSLIQTSPMSRVAPSVDAPQSEPGAITDVGWAVVPGGRLTSVPSKDVKERIEDQIIPEIMWSLRNGLVPTIKHFSGGDMSGHAPPKSLLPEGAVSWRFHPFRQEWIPVYPSEYRYSLPK